MSELCVEGGRPRGRAASAAAAFAAVSVALRKMADGVRREGEIRRARRRLEAMPDSMLRDIGIDRCQIDVLTRVGRSEFGRRYL